MEAIHAVNTALWHPEQTQKSHTHTQTKTADYYNP